MYKCGLFVSFVNENKNCRSSINSLCKSLTKSGGDKMWPRNEADSYAPTGFFGSLCNAMSSCLGLLCCCWLCRDCLGRERRPTTPLLAPPPSTADDRLAQLGGPHSPFEPRPPGRMEDRLGGHYSPFGLSNPFGHPDQMDDRVTHLGSPHSPFEATKTPPPPGPVDDRLVNLGGPRSPFGVSDAPAPPGLHRPPIQHGSMVHRQACLNLPRVPGVQPGLL